MNRLIPTLVLLAGCGKGGGLGDIPGIERYLPKVTFDRLAIRDLSFRDIDTAFVLDVKNPNPLRVKLSSFSWDLELDDRHFLGGENAQGLELEASGTSKVKVPVKVVFTELIDMLDVGKGKDAVPFAFRGKFGFDTPLGEIKVPWRAHGEFPVLRPPKVAFQGLRLKDLDLLHQSATLALDLALSHDQGSTLDFTGFDYALSFGGNHVLDGAVERLGKVAPGERRVVTLPLTVNLLAVGRTVADAIRGGGKVDVGLDAKVQVATPFGVVPLAIDERGDLRIGR